MRIIAKVSTLFQTEEEGTSLVKQKEVSVSLEDTSSLELAEAFREITDFLVDAADEATVIGFKCFLDKGGQ